MYVHINKRLKRVLCYNADETTNDASEKEKKYILYPPKKTVPSPFLRFLDNSDDFSIRVCSAH